MAETSRAERVRAHATTPLDAAAAIAGDKGALGSLCAALKGRGWAVLEPLPAVQAAAKDVGDAAAAFFELLDADKAPWQMKAGFGYVPGPGARDGLRILTGGMAPEPEAIPAPLREPMARLTAAYDGAAYALAAALCKPGARGRARMPKTLMKPSMEPFAGTPQEVGAKGNLPLLAYYRPDSDSGNSGSGSGGGSGGGSGSGSADMVKAAVDVGSAAAYGMLDIVQYVIGPDEEERRGYHVAPHVDPGLFALSAGSTAPGLQLYEPELDEWLSPPPEAFVIWAGVAAAELSAEMDPARPVKPALHRVQLEYDEAAAGGDAAPLVRRTMWYELCVDAQVSLEVRNAGKLLLVDADTAAKPIDRSTASKHAVPVAGTERYGRGLRVSSFSGQSFTPDVFWLPDVDFERDTVDVVQKRIESILGVPFMKLRAYVELHHPEVAKDIEEAHKRWTETNPTPGDPIAEKKEAHTHAVSERSLPLRTLLTHTPLELGTDLPLSRFGIKPGDLLLTTFTKQEPQRLREMLKLKSAEDAGDKDGAATTTTASETASVASSSASASASESGAAGADALTYSS